MFNIIVTPKDNPETVAKFLANEFFSEPKIKTAYLNKDVEAIDGSPYFKGMDFNFYKKIIQGQTILMAKNNDNAIVFIFSNETFLVFPFVYEYEPYWYYFDKNPEPFLKIYMEEE